MRPVYLMLSIAGWVWLGVLVGYVAWRTWRGRSPRPTDPPPRKEP